MTIINPNSISGITSFTAEADVMNFYRSNGTLGSLQLNGCNFNTTNGISTFNNLVVGGTLTYEDVKNVDSVGIISARTAIHVGAGISAVGIITGTSFRGDGSQLTGITQVGGATTVGFDDNKSIYFGSQDDYRMGWSGTTMTFEPTSSSTTQILHLTSNNQMYIKSKASGLFLMSGNQNVIDIYGGYGGGIYFKNNNTQYLKLEYSNWTFLNNTEVRIPDKLVHAGDENTSIRFPAADTITAETAGSERLRIDSSGRVLIGTTTEGAAGADELTIATSGHTGITLRSGTTSDCQIFFSDATSGAGEYQGYIYYSHGDENLVFGTNQTERLSIDSNGRLLIGTQRTYSDATWYDDITINNSNGSGQTGGTGITLISSSNSWGSILFGDNNDNNIGAIKYDHNTNSMRFVVNTIDPSLLITSAGNVGINPDSNGPDQLLHVSDTSNAGQVKPFRLTNTGGSPSTEVLMEFECGVDEIATISAKNEGSDTGPLIFSTASSQNAYPSEKVRITKDGRLFVNSTAVVNTDDFLTIKRPAGNHAVTSLTLDATTATGSYANALIFTKSKNYYYNGLVFTSSDGHQGGIAAKMTSGGGTTPQIEIRIGGSSFNQSDKRAFTVHATGECTQDYVPCWALRPSYGTTQTLGGGTHAIGWSSSDSGIHSVNAFLQNVTLGGSTFGNNIHNGQNYGKIIVPVAGKYQINCSIRLENNPTQGNLWLYVNGSLTRRQHVEMWGHRPYMHGQITTVVDLPANGHIVWAITASGGYITGLNDKVNHCSGHLIG